MNTVFIKGSSGSGAYNVIEAGLKSFGYKLHTIVCSKEYILGAVGDVINNCDSNGKEAIALLDFNNVLEEKKFILEALQNSGIMNFVFTE